MRTPKLKTAKRGRTFYDQNAHRLLRVEGDVLGVISEITLRWPELHVFWDDVDEHWVVAEVQANGDESLTTTAKELDQRLIDRLAASRDLSADQLLKQIDDHNAKIEREQDHRLAEAAGDLGERLIHALKRDGIYNHFDVYGTNRRRRMERRRTINPVRIRE
jgi:hypothetical protein